MVLALPLSSLLYSETSLSHSSSRRGLASSHSKNHALERKRRLKMSFLVYLSKLEIHNIYDKMWKVEHIVNGRIYI